MTPAPTPRSAEAVAREVVREWLIACHAPAFEVDEPDHGLTHSERRLIAAIAAALTAHATAAVAAEREPYAARLAAVTVEEVARHLAEWTPDGTVTRIERDMAAAVLALLRARVAGLP